MNSQLYEEFSINSLFDLLCVHKNTNRLGDASYRFTMEHEMVRSLRLSHVKGS